MLVQKLITVLLAIALWFMPLTAFADVAPTVPETAKEVFRAGVLAFQKEDYAVAIEQFNQAIQLDANYAAAYSDRCLAYLQLENYSAAILDCTQALKLS
jgi:Flp pilus assembly protein TadD